jgi:cobaltochelatase CobN
VKGYLFNKAVMEYYHNQTIANMVNMVHMAVRRHMDYTVKYEPLKKLPEVYIHHPNAPHSFQDTAVYRKWYADRTSYAPEKPSVGILFYGTTLKEGRVESADALIQELQTAGFNLPACFGPV